MVVQDQAAIFAGKVVNVAVAPVARRGGRAKPAAEPAAERFVRKKPSARDLRELLAKLGWIEKRSMSMVCVLLSLAALG